MAFRINQLSQPQPTKQPEYYKDKQFAQYLAGVIDARGKFTDQGHIELNYRLRNARNAYALRSLLGHGEVQIITQTGISRAVLRIGDVLGFREIMIHVYGNLRNPTRIKEFNEIFHDKLNYIRTPTPSNLPIEWDSPWFAGVADGSGSSINVTMRWDIKRCRHQARVSFELVLDDKWVLEQVKKRFGGYLIKSKSYRGYHHYSTVAGKFKTIFRVMEYFNQYPPQFHFFYLKYANAYKAWQILQQEKYFHPKRTRGLTHIGMVKMMIACHRFLPTKRRVRFHSVL